MKALITSKVIIEIQKDCNIQYRVWYILFVPVLAYRLI